MATPNLSPSPVSPSPNSNGASGLSSLQQRLWWLISALSGTLDINADIERLKHEKLLLRQEKLLLKQEKLQQESEIERLIELDSKLNALQQSWDANLPPVPEVNSDSET
ncbi:hypothetical protein [Synechococcus sp. PCC 6312]|uniref:hypothetical protein n=1 Tax=Synechococcus sp. (strain ATCC 27167 / PCC 6312) TaxID=195253 RepID=UPI00029EE537|nr:hypothetical protein [Synechococcus sp. PCC 6312]AFY62353.1 hypothetical protein Syn6312_3311 [Synechococcus sp. PCC 6312]